MPRFDRPFTLTLAGALALAGAAGCRSARYQMAERPSLDAEYGATPLPSRRIPEPPSAFGPSVPVFSARPGPGVLLPEPTEAPPALPDEDGPALQLDAEDQWDNAPEVEEVRRPAASARPRPISGDAADNRAAPATTRRPAATRALVPLKNPPPLLTPPSTAVGDFDQ